MKMLQGHLSIPQDVLTAILSMLALNRLKFVLFRGTRIGRNRHITISSYRLQATVDEDDLYSEK